MPPSNGGYTATLNLISGPDNNLVINNFSTDFYINFSGFQVGASIPYVFTITYHSICCDETFTTEPIKLQNLGIPLSMNVYPTGLGYYNRGIKFICAPEGGQPGGASNPISYFVDLTANPNGSLTSITNGSRPSGAAAPTPLAIANPGNTLKEIQVVFNDNPITPGTYEFIVTGASSSGECTVTNSVYIHISDGRAQQMNIPDYYTCEKDGAGNAFANISITPSPRGGNYLNNIQTGFTAYIRNISKPAGSTTIANKVMQIGETSATISNLMTPGVYVFEYTMNNLDAYSGPLLAAEYDCAGVNFTDQFTITVASPVGANAGTDQVFTCTTGNNLIGNDPGFGNTGLWTLVSKPSGASDPILVDPSNFSTLITGVDLEGIYTYNWTVTNPNGQGCVSSDIVQVQFTNLAPSILASNTDETCAKADGTITATINKANGSTAPYTYTLINQNTNTVIYNASGVFTGLVGGK